MSRLLVVLTRDGALEGVLADECEVRDGERVFLRGDREVLRAPQDLPLVVRAVPAQRPPLDVLPQTGTIGRAAR